MIFQFVLSVYQRVPTNPWLPQMGLRRAQPRCSNGPNPVVLAVPRPRFRGVRAGAGAAESDDDSDADLDLHWPQGPPAEHGADQQVMVLMLMLMLRQ